MAMPTFPSFLSALLGCFFEVGFQYDFSYSENKPDEAKIMISPKTTQHKQRGSWARHTLRAKFQTYDLVMEHFAVPGARW